MGALHFLKNALNEDSVFVKIRILEIEARKLISYLQTTHSKSYLIFRKHSHRGISINLTSLSVNEIKHVIEQLIPL